MERYAPALAAVLSLLAVLLVALQRRPPDSFRPLEAGMIYDGGTATRTTTVPGTSTTEERLPIFSVYTELRTPDRFIAEVVPSRARADFVLVDDALLARRTLPVEPRRVTGMPPARSPSRTIVRTGIPEVHVPAPQKTPERAAPTPVPSTPAPATTAAVRPLRDLHALTAREARDLVRASDLTWHFTGHTVGRDLRLRLVSRTPYADRSILTFRIENARPGYVFLSGVWVMDATGEPLDAPVLAERFVSGESTMEGYIILPPGVRRAVLKIAETGGAGAILEVPFSL